MKKVLIPTKLESVARQILEKHGGYQVIQDDKTDISELAKKHPDCHALIVRSEKITPAVMNLLPALKVIVRAGSGLQPGPPKPLTEAAEYPCEESNATHVPELSW